MSASSPTLLFGGIRSTVIDFRGLQSELSRSNSQIQDLLQDVNALTSADSTNEATQTEANVQDVSEVVTNSITVDPALPPEGGIPAKFFSTFSYIQKLSEIANLIDLLNSTRADNTQTQRVGQTAFASLSPDATISDASNTLTQDASNEQTLDHPIVFDINAQTGTLPVVVAREREIIIEAARDSTTGIFNSTQRQGASPESSPLANNPSFQTARADGDSATNFLSQLAVSTQNNNVVNTQTVDVRQIAGTDSAIFTPRSMTILLRMNQVTGDVNKVSNTGAAVQQQALVQTARGGVDQNNNPTGNGGSVLNTSLQEARSADTSTVRQFFEMRG